MVEGAAQGGRCPRSGYKNSVKGKGAIKHKGAPPSFTIVLNRPFWAHQVLTAGKRKMVAKTESRAGGAMKWWRGFAWGGSPKGLRELLLKYFHEIIFMR